MNKSDDVIKVDSNVACPSTFAEMLNDTLDNLNSSCPSITLVAFYNENYDCQVAKALAIFGQQHHRKNCCFTLT